MRSEIAATAPAGFSQRHPRLILTLAVLACLLPFADKAIHIDDPLFVWAARQMQTQWWNPYGFNVNWYGSLMPMHEVTKNPPLASAYLAILRFVFGENEFSFHAGFIVQALALLLGTYALARRFCKRPLCAALATLLTPVFMVSSTTLMCDVLMLALWVWALEFWMRGLEKIKPLLLLLAGLLISASALSKYFGIALVPLLFAFTFAREKKIGSWLFYLLIPVLLIGLYEWGTRALYGHGLVADAFSYANRLEPRPARALFLKPFTVLGFVGGCCAVVMFCAPILWTRRVWIWSGGALLLLLVCTWVLLGTTAAYANNPSRLGIAFQWSVMILGGISVLALPLLDWKAHRSAESLLLGLWIFGTVAFCALNWTINARSILPLAPAIAILLLRRLENETRWTTSSLSWAFAGSGLLSLFVTLSDYRLANSARDTAAEIKDHYAATSPIWFQGHWGFQYYAQENGMTAFDSAHAGPRPGDLIVLPSNNTNLIALAPDRVERLIILETASLQGVATMSGPVGAGFYMDIRGPLPFAFGSVPTEKYQIFRCK